MSAYAHSITATESACGVTLEQVAEIMPKVLLLDNDRAVMLPKDTAPALASSVARCVFNGAPAEFSHLKNGYPIYRLL